MAVASFGHRSREAVVYVLLRNKLEIRALETAGVKSTPVF
jgi:hypothetical protein